MSEDASKSSIHSKVTSAFKRDIIREALKTQYSNSKTKITDEAVDVMHEILRVLVTETATRAAKNASSESKSTVTLNHLEDILPQIMLDFP